MVSYSELNQKKEKISIIGLGYVGLPLAVAFAGKMEVVGFDLNQDKLNQYRSGHDVTGEVGDTALKSVSMIFTSDEQQLKACRFHIVAVPTPINSDKTPDLNPVVGASRLLGKNLVPGSIVVYESTVYPGVTEEVCVPILEQESGLKCGVDFKVGYSPERINPGDKLHRLETIVKVVSGQDEESLNTIADVYGSIIQAGVHRTTSIRVAEAAKVIENAQRDINIAFMNELSIIFNKMGINTQEVLKAARTKWNFLPFEPGLVGGHCIGVDPYYLTYKAEQLGYRPEVILAGRRINDNMGKYAAENTVKMLIRSGCSVKDAKVAIWGFTFKEDCPDTRNTRVVDIVEELKTYGIEPLLYDPVADAHEAHEEYGVHFSRLEDMSELDGMIIAVKHQPFLQLSVENIKSFLKDHGVVADLKGILNGEDIRQAGYDYWRF